MSVKSGLAGDSLVGNLSAVFVSEFFFLSFFSVEGEMVCLIYLSCWPFVFLPTSVLFDIYAVIGNCASVNSQP